MLDTMFHKKHRQGLPQQHQKNFQESHTRVWSYVGRFIWGFASIEYDINQLFDDVFDVGAAGLLLTYSLDLRKKVELLAKVLESRGIDESKTFKRIHAFHDLRNVFAHWPFEEDECGEGLWCDYVDKHEELTFSRPGTRTKDRSIKFAETRLL
jgi:hypothetical protein